MKELLLSLGLLCAISTNIFSQQSIEKCGFDQVHQKMMEEDASYRKKTNLFNQSLQNFNKSSMAASPYRVPTVVHVMHKGEAIGSGSNISDADVKSGIQYLNERLRKTAGGVGDGAGVDTQIEYALAVRDPSGICTNGIVRYDMSGDASFMACGLDLGGGCGISDAGLKVLSRWNPNQYYNIYLVYEIDDNECGSGVQGYAYFASAHGGTQDGAVMLSCTFGGSSGTTLTHELGHSLNLYHTFEGDGGGGSCPANGNCNTDGDQCCDIPPHGRSGSNCPAPFANTCDGGSSSELFVHNFLDYSSDACQSEFTADQTVRMQAALTGTRASFLEANGNMSLVPPSAPSADFIANASFVCNPATIKFLDNSVCIPNTYENDAWTSISFAWSFDNGVNPVINSTDQNPSITFTNDGSYDVTLQVTNSNGTHSITKNSFIVVGSSPIAACSPSSTNEGNFGQTINNVSLNTINNSTSTITNVGYTDFSCSSNTVVTSGANYDISVTFRSGGSGSGEVMETYIDYNNNGTFEAGELVLSGSIPTNMAPTTATATITIPTTAVKNTLLRMRVIGETSSISNNEKSCLSNYFIGDVEDYGVYVSDPIPVSINLYSFKAYKRNKTAILEWFVSDDDNFSHFEIQKSNEQNNFSHLKLVSFESEKTNYSFYDKSPKQGANYYRLKLVDNDGSFVYSQIRKLIFEKEEISLYPNPFKNVIALNGLNSNANVRVVNIVGQLVINIKLSKGVRVIDTSDLVDGTYIVTIQTENNIFVEKLIKSTK